MKEEIISRFTLGGRNIPRRIEGLPEDMPAWVLKSTGGFGVFILTDDPDLAVNEQSQKCVFRTARQIVEGREQPVLELMCVEGSNELFDPFAEICAQFVDPGKDGTQRRELLEDPLRWWEDHISLFGNRMQKREPAAVIAEMTVLLELQKQKKHPLWSGPDGGSQDIQTPDFNVEVKSTAVKHSLTISVNSRYQLESKPMFLSVIRLERNLQGICIDELENLLVQEGYPAFDLESRLERLGYPRGRSGRKEKYRLLGQYTYKVDESFPVLTEEIFRKMLESQNIPAGIQMVSYVIDLNQVPVYSRREDFSELYDQCV